MQARSSKNVYPNRDFLLSQFLFTGTQTIKTEIAFKQYRILCPFTCRILLSTCS